MIADSNILFTELKLPRINREQALLELNSVSDELWHWDKFRNTSMLPIMTKDGLIGRDSLYYLSEHKADYSWTPTCPPCIRDYFEKHIFDWLRPRPRIVILKTLAGAKNNEHIDCQPFEFGTRQIKFRYVLSGQSDSLYFITTDGRVAIPQTDLPFLIDGSWPHGMHNTSTVSKITICVGAPWSGADVYPEFGKTLNKSDYHLPKNYTDYFKKDVELKPPQKK